MSDEFDRKAWMGLLARAPAADLDRLWARAGFAPEHSYLRPPEVGGVMVRGRAGATGAPFNLGEMTVTRCALRLADGAVGHGYVQGRGKQHAVQAAMVDALMQGPQAKEVRAAVLEPLAEAEASRRAARTAKAAATKVDFFTMVRGED
ncbi:alpha-D-ribose 1-methylphosphonate 5-triphosphate synthase subunit PhnG [Roseovarius azorensis]|uniref:Alpha-D-ribose 1-methylphosphonate 5-triphosphate synthase subunit PhnG n=1 Tax=Roseovarius azorensis TaxID=1287727 RepID=A0A1H7UBA7_9RHOB|nr:phosphonate C-P lyase system protein PhnG [Roseovarius azorensis]SEL94350.1 alpha-D-ribose 1-methylphosphonate 5-triphosphate synthase subunit PhnG [Roseovarius azorensis]